ncbi:MAG TPA: SpoIIE family protein phosphatase [Micromonosporaceae bacterium]
MSSALGEGGGGSIDERGLGPALVAAFAGGGEMGGRIRDLDWSGLPLGTPDGWSPAFRAALGMMLASQAQIIMFWGDDYRAFYNDAYVPIVGSKHPHLIGEPGRRLWPEIWQFLEPIFAGVRRMGQAYHGRDHPFLLDRHGYLEETYFDISYDPLREDDGSLAGIYCIVSETTGRVLGERRLRALTELAGRLGEATTVAELGSAASAVLDGYRDDLPFTLLYLADDRSRGALAGCSGVDRALVEEGHLPEPVAAVLAGQPARPADATDFLRTVPELADRRALVLPVSDATGPVGVLVVGVSRRLALSQDYRNFLDLVAAQISSALSNQRAYEQERARSAELAALDRAKTAFFANVSHEFRTPLTLLLGPIEDALAEPDLAPPLRERLAMMHRNALRLLKLVNTLLDFARLESGRLEATFRPTDLAEYTAGLAGTFRSATERVGLRLEVDVAPLPEPVYVDRDMWEKIVFNLLSNALKFTFDGTVTVRVRERHGRAQLQVADTGVGVPPHELPHIFERFHRASGRRGRSHEGTGIGLSLVNELVKMHGGSIDVASRVDEGSVFTVLLPLGAAHLPCDQIVENDTASTPSDNARMYADEVGQWAAPADSSRPGSGSTDAATGRGARRFGRILLADDNADLRDHVSRLLSPYWDVVGVGDGAAALDAAFSSPFDLVLTDVMMPGLDGFGLVSALRADPRTRHLPIVMISARAGEEAAVAGLSAGVDDYLVKPFSGRELVARVRSNVELGQLRGQIIRQMRALADTAVAVNTVRSTGDVVRVAAQHARALVRAARVLAKVPGARFEADDSGDLQPAEPATVVPLVGTDGGQLGELNVWPRGELRPDAAEALAQLARLVGLRLENAQLYEAEHRIASTLQHSLLPRSTPQVPGAVVVSRYLAGTAEAEVGGDWYDVIPVGAGELVLVIGDVVGKGVAAAAAMGQLRNALRAYVLEDFGPAEALTRLNRLVGTAGQSSYATVLCMRFDPATRQISYASAGHPPPLLVSPDGATHFLHSTALGPPIGALPTITYDTVEDRVEPGARLLLYTDGLVEDRRQGIDASLAQLKRDAGTSSEHLDDLVAVILDRVVHRPRRDDIAILALEVTELDRFTMSLPAEPTRLSRLRKRLEEFLSAHQVAETDIFDLTVAVSEAAANAIEHPVDPRRDVVDVEVSIDNEAVVATVRDSGRWRAATNGGNRGRGLALIGALAEVSVTRSADGTAVSFRRRLSR